MPATPHSVGMGRGRRACTGGAVPREWVGVVIAPAHRLWQVREALAASVTKRGCEGGEWVWRAGRVDLKNLYILQKS